MNQTWVYLFISEKAQTGLQNTHQPNDKSRLLLAIKFFSERLILRSETIFGIWKPFKKDEKCFLFHIKSSFGSQDI